MASAPFHRQNASGHRATLSGEPGHDVGDLPLAERLARRVAAPVRHAEIAPPGDDRRPQILIAHQGEIRRIGDRAALGTAFALWAVAGGARRRIHGLAARGVPGGGGVWRQAGDINLRRLAPLVEDAAY